jgi:class 3 adenylate cyclase
VQPPVTRYADRDGVGIAYQVVGEGPFDLVVVPGFVSHLDLQWSDPAWARVLRRLASFSRLILFDKPGTGISDPLDHVPTLEERAADVLAVMDAAGSREASLFGLSEGGPATMMTAAIAPDRVRSLVLYGTFAVAIEALSEAERAMIPDLVARARAQWARVEDCIAHWGEGRMLPIFAPSVDSELRRRWFATFERGSASPRMARALNEHTSVIDVREVAKAVRAPALVLHVRDDPVVPVEAGRFLAAMLPDARLVELPGRDHMFVVAPDPGIVDAAEEFLTGARRATEPDRVLATVLFTDVVGSTEHAAAVGDQAWRELLERHDALVDEQVRAHGGHVVKHVGDGVLAVFDGPARAVRCAEALCAAVAPLGLALRAGVHTGECELIGDDVGGMAVHIGARVAAHAGPGEVVVSGTVKDLVVGSGLEFAERGEHELKGVPGTWRLYELAQPLAAAS